MGEAGDFIFTLGNKIRFNAEVKWGRRSKRKVLNEVFLK